MDSKGKKSIYYLLGGVCILWSIFFVIQSCSQKQENTSLSAKSQVGPEHSLIAADPNYIGTKRCASCHNEEYETWKGSHHDHSMDEANPNTVLASFDSIAFESQGVNYLFFKKGSSFWVNTEGDDGGYKDFEISYVFGVEPLQQYIINFPDGNMQCLRVAWDTQKKEWYDLYDTTKVEVDEWIHWTKGGLRWNTMCADCHSTNLKKNFKPSTGEYNTTFNQIDVSCESCHGPGKKHVEWVKNPKDVKKYDLLKLTSGISSKEQVDQCARCHSLRGQVTKSFDHSGVFMDHYTPDILREGNYHADGQILGEVYVYGSFIQSKMYHNGVRCTDCHEPHSLKLKWSGNTLCTSCHIPEKYDVIDHFQHPVGSEGAQCINCHMPGRYYMGNDFRRDHSFRIPRPDLSEKYGTPNACNDCHTDKSTNWATKAVEKWHGKQRPSHFSEILVKASDELLESIPEIIELAKDASQPAIARATAAYHLSKVPNEQTINTLIDLYHDEEPLVRYTSLIYGKDYLPIEDRIKVVGRILQDSIRSVRIAAAELLTELLVPQMDAVQVERFNKAFREFNDALVMSADFPSGQMRRAEYYQRIGNQQGEEAAYKKAILLDNRFNAARFNLAMLYYGQKKVIEAEKLFKKVIDQEPQYDQAHYSLGLLLAEQKRMEEAAIYMKKAVSLTPENTRFRYNYALILQRIRKYAESEKEFKIILAQNPNDEGVTYALAYLHYEKKDYGRAKKVITSLLQSHPQNRNYQRLAAQIKSAE